MSTPSSQLDQTASNVCEWIPGYELLSSIGAGGCGVVYKARQLALDRLVAIKLIRFDHAESQNLSIRFEKEAVTLGKLHHPNIVQIYDYGRQGGRVFLAMELLEGEDLAQRLEEKKILDERTGWAIAHQIASALAHAALHGVIHRDIKPANLFLVPPPRGIGWPRNLPCVKVMDFGLAFTKSGMDVDEIRLTRTNATPGTPLYMAPEQSRKSADLDHRADIYALGATIFHAISGRPPFPGPTLWDLVLQKLDHNLRFESHLSPDSVELLKAMMEPEPENRIATYDELIERIEGLSVMRELVNGISGTEHVIARPSYLRRSSRILRKRWHWITVASLLSLAGAGLALRGESHPDLRYELASEKYLPYGDRISLFGRSMSTWFPISGRWTTEEDNDQAIVLAGSGFIRKEFQPEADFQITIGLDLYQAKASEIHFAIPRSAPEKESRLVLRVSREQGALFGTREGDKGAFIPIDSPSILFLPTNWSEDSRPYFEVKIERAGRQWIALYNGSEVGRVNDDSRPKLPELRIGTEGGKARIDTVEFSKLKKV
jgi:serine/threonine protein kinase